MYYLLYKQGHSNPQGFWNCIPLQTASFGEIFASIPNTAVDVALLCPDEGWLRKTREEWAQLYFDKVWDGKKPNLCPDWVKNTEAFAGLINDLRNYEEEKQT